MSDIFQIVILFSFMAIMAIFFAAVFIMIIRYLLSFSNLLTHIKSHESDLWRSLDSPTLIPLFHISHNPIKGYFALLKFLVWFLKGGKNTTKNESSEMVMKTRKLFKQATIGFTILSSL